MNSWTFVGKECSSTKISKAHARINSPNSTSWKGFEFGKVILEDDKFLLADPTYWIRCNCADEKWVRNFSPRILWSGWCPVAINLQIPVLTVTFHVKLGYLNHGSHRQQFCMKSSKTVMTPAVKKQSDCIMKWVCSKWIQINAVYEVCMDIEWDPSVLQSVLPQRMRAWQSLLEE